MAEKQEGFESNDDQESEDLDALSPEDHLDSSDVHDDSSQEREKEPECSLNPQVNFSSFEEQSITCSFCPRQFSRESSYKRHLQTHMQDPIKCEYCGRICPKKSVLIKHLRTHTGEKPYKCEFCSLQFATKPSLDYHLMVHKGERPFVCKQCGKGFIQNSHLTRHLRVHTGEKPYCCSYCSMKFSRQGSLQVHLRRHTGEVLFTCTHCDRKFTNESTFKYHLKRLSGQKPYSCNICKCSFINSSHLKKHIKIHLRNLQGSDIKPPLNKKENLSSSEGDSESSFSSVSLLDYSLNADLLIKPKIESDSPTIKTTTRNYHCSYCPLKFIRRTALQSHLAYHEASTKVEIKDDNNEHSCLDKKFLPSLLCDVVASINSSSQNMSLNGTSTSSLGKISVKLESEDYVEKHCQYTNKIVDEVLNLSTKDHAEILENISCEKFSRHDSKEENSVKIEEKHPAVDINYCSKDNSSIFQTDNHVFYKGSDGKLHIISLDVPETVSCYDFPCRSKLRKNPFPRKIVKQSSLS